MYPHGYASLIIGMAGPYYSNGKALLSVFFHEEFLTFDLIPRILPVRVCKGGAFRDDVICGRLMISRGGAYIYILSGFIFKQPIVSLHVLYGKSDEFTDGIEDNIPQFFDDSLLIIDIRDDLIYTFRQHILSVSAV